MQQQFSWAIADYDVDVAAAVTFAQQLTPSLLAYTYLLERAKHHIRPGTSEDISLDPALRAYNAWARTIKVRIAA